MIMLMCASYYICGVPYCPISIFHFILMKNDNCGGKSPNWYNGPWALFQDMDTSEEE